MTFAIYRNIMFLYLSLDSYIPQTNRYCLAVGLS
nr:MAG TPA: hypothetical protein [Inoviridae sp.]